VGNNKEHYHNKGQSDASDNKYEPPHGIIDDLTTWSDWRTKKHREENESYNEGWSHTDDQKSDSSGCFLTTACVEHAGLPDDCEELVSMRRFRDEYLVNLPGGAAVLDEYYCLAPRIIMSIKSKGDAAWVFDKMLSDLRDAISLIKAGRQAEALEFCRQRFEALKKTHLETTDGRLSS
jgi:hypothetical protein